MLWLSRCLLLMGCWFGLPVVAAAPVGCLLAGPLLMACSLLAWLGVVVSWGHELLLGVGLGAQLSVVMPVLLSLCAPCWGYTGGSTTSVNS